MGALFSPKPPPVKEPPPVPVVDKALVDRQAADIARMRKGRAATDLTSGSANSTTGSVASKQLLGA